MTDGDFDPALFGAWPMQSCYSAAPRPEAGLADDEIWRILDRKAGDTPAGEELAEMLNGMTRELREQMQMFQMLRQQTDRRITDAGEEIDRKTAQADAKASIEAMSLIVRTLEKIDSLQRTLAQDRERRDAEELDDAGYQSLLGKLETLVEQRAVDRCRERGDGSSAVERRGDDGARTSFARDRATEGGATRGGAAAGGDPATGERCAADAAALADDRSGPATGSGIPLAPYG